jgi:hypothetical protein
LGSTVYKLLHLRKRINTHLTSGKYKLKCHSCNKVYFGQKGTLLQTKFKEHLAHIRENKNQSACALYILSNRHKRHYGYDRNIIKATENELSTKFVHTKISKSGDLQKHETLMTYIFTYAITPTYVRMNHNLTLCIFSTLSHCSPVCSLHLYTPAASCITDMFYKPYTFSSSIIFLYMTTAILTILS